MSNKKEQYSFKKEQHSSLFSDDGVSEPKLEYGVIQKSVPRNTETINNLGRRKEIARQRKELFSQVDSYINFFHDAHHENSEVRGINKYIAFIDKKHDENDNFEWIAKYISSFVNDDKKKELLNSFVRRITSIDDGYEKAALTDSLYEYIYSIHDDSKKEAFLNEASQYITHIKTKKQDAELSSQVAEYIAYIDDNRYLELLEDFKAFFTAYNAYFWHIDVEKTLKNNKSEKMKYECLLSRVLDKTRNVWVRLVWAINQRYSPFYIDKLKEADRICTRLMDLSGYIAQGKPIAYFDKVFDITRYPYQKHPLIGIPLDRFESDGEAIIAHELGHHIFWNSGDMSVYDKRIKVLRSTINKAIFGGCGGNLKFSEKDIKQTESVINKKKAIYHIWTTWSEEVFADIYATLLLGPVFVKSSQDILVRGVIASDADLFNDDGDHPMPWIRPFISLAALGFMLEKQNKKEKNETGLSDKTKKERIAARKDMVNVLEQRWENSWQAALAKHEEECTPQSCDVLPREISAYLTQIVEEIITAPIFSKTEGNLEAGEKNTDSLEDVLSGHWWAKENNLESMKTISDDYKDDGLHDKKYSGEIKKDSYTPSNDSSNPFDQLLQYTRDNKEDNDLQEWEEILSLRLSFVHAHEDCRMGNVWINIKHKYVGNTPRKC